MEFKYLSKNVLLGFDNYKYSSVDTSPVSIYIMHPFWNWLVKFYPMWLAPNVLTFSGFMLLVITLLLFTIFDYNYEASNDLQLAYPPIPDFIFLVAGFSFFWAHQLDGTDGKQARRTGSSNPLGELMDHGLDSLASVIMPLCLYSIIGCGDSQLPPIRLYYVLLSIAIMFFFTHWEKYNTGVLYLPWGYDISQLGMTLIFFLTYLWGTKVWKVEIWEGGCTAGHVFECMVHFSVWGMGIPMCLYNIYLSYRNKTGKMLSMYESLRPLTPMVLQCILFTYWIHASHCHIFNMHTRIFMLTFGAVYSNITCRCIVNGMSNTRAECFNMLLLPALTINIVLHSMTSSAVAPITLVYLELFMLLSYFLLASAVHLHYGIYVVKELAHHYNINVFTIKQQSTTKNKDNNIANKR
ncbi:hypothetical protein HELRODRAFT_115001 [Helobdella robusta]|uniref:Selenoprotein I n=1 Tax=Helobdella robusta TaxID=6412 RepID=T1EG58_HELRO|nr:hypothetical protein HELRODRAFT_115001 [Helobdella robusta]ESN95058.1 hypothetical protein HELRODRAFT_115001 [Helobdella robusta]